MNRFLLAALLGTASLSAAEEFFEDDFSEEVEGRWERIAGEWVVENGAMVHVQDYSAGHDRVVADFPFTEGAIEVKGVALATNLHRFASLGIVIKHLDEKSNIWFRFGSYGQKNVDGYGPSGFDGVLFGSGKPELGRTYLLSVVVRNGIIGVCIDDVMFGIMADPFAGKAGRPGVFSESGAAFDEFRVTRRDPGSVAPGNPSDMSDSSDMSGESGP